MTVEAFRRLALSLPEAVESSHMGHPDFRVRGKIFATIAPDGKRAGLNLVPDQQLVFMNSLPEVFVPAPGAWGARGFTMVTLRKAKKNTVQDALVMAWRNTAPKQLVSLHSGLG